LAKAGGERGIRTLDASFETYMISNHAPSTAQTPLLYPISTSLLSPIPFYFIGAPITKQDEVMGIEKNEAGDKRIRTHSIFQLLLCFKLLQCYFNITWAIFFSNRSAFFCNRFFRGCLAFFSSFFRKSFIATLNRCSKFI
jgi:hypothetical protein